ncbi:hypothetical protein V3C99_007037 [Haemonchus contortus]|nr:Protein of unknown function DUF148 domain containing protein [Haemonchus contortus]
MHFKNGVVAVAVLTLARIVRMDQSGAGNGDPPMIIPQVSDSYEVLRPASTPEFLNLATDNQRKEYIELESNMNVPVGTLRKAQDAWAQKIGGPVLDAYIRHVATEDAAKAAEAARMDKAVGTLSQAAQEADKVIRGIIMNESLTRKEINALVASQMQLLPPRVFNELTVALQ